MLLPIGFLNQDVQGLIFACSMEVTAKLSIIT